MEEQKSVQLKPKGFSDFQIILFIVILCSGCGLLLAVTSFSLEFKQKNAKEFDQSKQMLIAAKILNYKGGFEILQADGKTLPARYDPKQQILIPAEGENFSKALPEEIKVVAELRIRPLLTDALGEIFSFEEKKIALNDYLEENKKEGYAKLPLKIFYAILPNEANAKEISAKELAEDLKKGAAFVFPVSGFGLWAPIYGYIALAPDGEHVVGATWYEHAETPGLGANITEPWWQKQFYGKDVFQGKDLATAEMGIIVVKGQVKDVYGNSPKAMSAVDGMSGATLTGDGVTQAYRNSLQPYRPLLIKLHGLTHGN